MKSYKNWKLVNESLFPLGIRQPHTVGGLQSPFGQFEEAAKKGKMHGKEDWDGDDHDDDGDGDGHSCKCNHKMKKKMKDKSKGDQYWDGDKNPVGDHSGKLQGGFPHSKKKKMAAEKKMADEKNMKKGMKKKMGGNDLLAARPPVDDEEDWEDEDEEGGDEEGGDEDWDDDDDPDEVDPDDKDGDWDEDGDDDDEDLDDVHGDDSDDDLEAAKFNFMKKKMKKAMKKKMREAKEFAEDLSSYPTPPEDHSGDSEAEFFASLKRQFGNPRQRFQSGLSEDLLIPLNNPDAPAVTPQEPGPGEPGYAPQGRVGAMGSYANESTDYDVLKKYLGEAAAKKLFNK